MTDTIRIDDLHEPRLSDAARAALERVEQIPFEFSAEAIIRAAREECDVPLFEDEDLFGRLAEYVEAVRADRNYSRMGRFGTYGSLKRQLIQRSRLEALFREHPEIDEVEIERPLIIAGLPRSGTTHLLNLLGSDPRFRTLPRWEAFEPIASLAARRGEAPDDRLANCQASLEQRDLFLPLFYSMYDVPDDGLHEEIELQGLCLSTILMFTGVNTTDWMRRYFERDQRPHYAFMKRAMQALQFLRPGERWILKSTQHLACLPALYETFPDATFVMTHRDPVAVLTSWLTLNAYAARLTRDPVRIDECVAHATLLQKYLLDGCARDYTVLPEAQVEHVYFHEYMADEIGTLDRIYARADFTPSPETRARLERYIAEHPRSRYGKLIYDLEGDFGIRREEAYELFSPYLKTFPVQREAPDR